MTDQRNKLQGLFQPKNRYENFGEAIVRMCQVPDDCIDPRRRALFIGRETMRELIEELRRQKS